MEKNNLTNANKVYTSRWNFVEREFKESIINIGRTLKSDMKKAPWKQL